MIIGVDKKNPLEGLEQYQYQLKAALECANWYCELHDLDEALIEKIDSLLKTHGAVLISRDEFNISESISLLVREFIITNWLSIYHDVDMSGKYIKIGTN